MADTGQGVIVGVADMATASAAQGRLITYALGSCIGLTAWDPTQRIGGMLHFMLPQPGEGADPKDLKVNMYATTGIPMMFRRLLELGCRRERLVVCAAGGAEVIHDSGVFAIGKRNRTILRKIFWKDGTAIAAEDSGGNQARTMSLCLQTGEVRVKTRDGEAVLWASGMAPKPQGVKT